MVGEPPLAPSGGVAVNLALSWPLWTPRGRPLVAPPGSMDETQCGPSGVQPVDFDRVSKVKGQRLEMRKPQSPLKVKQKLSHLRLRTMTVKA